MRTVQAIEQNEQSREERLPDFDPAFPYIATRVELAFGHYSAVPWHWHRAVELFYMEKGCLEYTTPGGKWVFPAGSGGFVNANVLHCTRLLHDNSGVQLLHLLEPSLLAGEAGSRIEKRYILPLCTSGVEVIPLRPEEPGHPALLEKLRAGFSLDETSWGYEPRIREVLMELWLALLPMAQTAPEQTRAGHDETIKALMIFVQEHFHEAISVDRLAQQAHISRRGCFRLFREELHMSPLEYIRGVRLQQAHRMLVNTNLSLTEIASRCGFSSGSYFGKAFREDYGCAPMTYRGLWHDRDKSGHK